MLGAHAIGTTNPINEMPLSPYPLPARSSRGEGEEHVLFHQKRRLCSYHVPPHYLVSYRGFGRVNFIAPCFTRVTAMKLKTALCTPVLFLTLSLSLEARVLDNFNDNLKTDWTDFSFVA